MIHTVKQTADVVRISATTVLAWSKEFANYLSYDANPPRGQTRAYSANDIAVFKTAKVLRDRQQPFDVIHATLARGERLEPVEVPLEPAAERPEREDTPPKPEGDAFTTALAVYDKQLANLQTQVSDITERLIDVETRAASEKTRADMLQDQVEKLEAQQVEAAQVEKKTGWWARLRGRD